MTFVANPAHSISILFVEDDEITLKLQTSVLTVRFPDVVIHTATNGKQGIELFKQHNSDIVITDINMPEICGIQMVTCIRALKPDTQFVAITGMDQEEIPFEFNHFIMKPVEFDKLFEAVEKCITYISKS